MKPIMVIEPAYGHAPRLLSRKAAGGINRATSRHRAKQNLNAHRLLQKVQVLEAAAQHMEGQISNLLHAIRVRDAKHEERGTLGSELYLRASSRDRAKLDRLTEKLAYKVAEANGLRNRAAKEFSHG